MEILIADLHGDVSGFVPFPHQIGDDLLREFRDGFGNRLPVTHVYLKGMLPAERFWLPVGDERTLIDASRASKRYCP